MKRLLTAALLLVMMTALAGCGSSPDTIVDAYFKAAQESDYEAMSETILPSNAEAIAEIANPIDSIEEETTLDETDTLDDFELSEKEPAALNTITDYFKDNNKKISYKITDTTEKGDSATVTVDVKYVDGGEVLENTILNVYKNIITMAFSGMEYTEEETTDMIVQEFKDQSKSIDEPTKEKTIKIKLEKSDGKWYISEANDDLLDVSTSGFISALSDYDYMDTF